MLSILLTVLLAPGPLLQENDSDPPPEHLSWWPGLYVREGDVIVDAPEEDQLVGMGYHLWEEKGEPLDGRRMTIMAAPGPVHVGDEVRVIHVVEAPEPGWEVYVMGPKTVYGEHLDGVPVTPAPPGWADPFVPELYDGAVLQSPAADYNYEMTSYVFQDPGVHRIQWIMDPWESNVLVVEVHPIPVSE